MRTFISSSTLLLFLLAGCSSSGTFTDDPDYLFVGRWAMDRVYEDGTEVTEEHNPADDRWIEFSPDGVFESGGQPYGHNSGKWTFDPDTGVLFIDSAAGEGDDSYWYVSFDRNKREMRWKGVRSDFTSRFELVHVKM